MQSVGRYQIESEIGRGAMGVVYKAHDPALGRTVAIKTIHLTGFDDSAARERVAEQLLREAQAAATLSHPNIVTIFDILQENEFAFIVMEYVAGSSLADKLESGQPVDRSQLVVLLRQVADALDYAHRKGIIHRDVKPANILATPAGEAHTLAKLTDFGIAKPMSQEATLFGNLSGTPSYMSPEQIAGGAVDGRSDQFSLAVVAYQALCGRKPFEADGLPALFQKISSEEPAPVAKNNTSLSSTVGKVLARALAKRPEDRFASVSDFVGALSIALAENHPSFGKTTVLVADPDESAPAPRRSSSKLALVVFLCFAVAAAIVFIARLNSGTPVPVQVVETHAARTTPLPASASTQQSAATTPKSEPVPAEKSAETTPKPSPAPSPSHSRGVIVPETPAGSFGSTADIDLISQPAGARIVVDGRSDATCNSPCTMALPTGRHTLTAQLDGYTVAHRIFNLPETRTLYVPLERGTGTLVLTSVPSGATVMVDGKPAGQTPVTLHLSPGVHQLVLARGGAQHQERINVEPDGFDARTFRW